MIWTWILLGIVLLLLLAAIPAWPHSRRWGWGPGGVLLVLLIAAIILVILF